MRLGEKINEFRTKQKLSLRQFASLVSINYEKIYRLEKGESAKLSSDDYNSLANVFEMSFDEIIKYPLNTIKRGNKTYSQIYVQDNKEG